MGEVRIRHRSYNEARDSSYWFLNVKYLSRLVSSKPLRKADTTFLHIIIIIIIIIIVIVIFIFIT
jgi:hypothetical protein